MNIIIPINNKPKLLIQKYQNLPPKTQDQDQKSQVSYHHLEMITIILKTPKHRVTSIQYTHHKSL